jgi:hypothetical protein
LWQHSRIVGTSARHLRQGTAEEKILRGEQRTKGGLCRFVIAPLGILDGHNGQFAIGEPGRKDELGDDERAGVEGREPPAQSHKNLEPLGIALISSVSFIALIPIGTRCR